MKQKNMQQNLGQRAGYEVPALTVVTFNENFLYTDCYYYRSTGWSVRLVCE